MAQFDPLLRRETLCFQRTSEKDSDGTECLRLLPFKFVEYDGNPDRCLEPMNISPFLFSQDGQAGDCTPVNPTLDGTTIAKIEIFDSITTIWEGVHEFHFA